jgi:glucokinase
MSDVPAHDTPLSARVALAIEIAEGGMRIVATRANANANTNAAQPGRQWRCQMSAPPAPDELLAALDALIGQALADETGPADHPSAITVALWDEVDASRGLVRGMRHAPDPSTWADFPLAARLSERWRAAVIVQSAVAAAGLAEARVGAGQGYRVALYLHSGRTITSALIADGAITPDATGRAGMLGHWLVGPDGPRCACGLRGHLDPLASAQSIVRATIGLASGSDASTAAMLRVSGGRAEAMTVAQLTQLAREGDPAAQTVLEGAWDALAVSLANLVAALDPDVIILGGATGAAGEAFCGPLRERLAALCEAWRPTPDLLPGSLGAHATLIGAGLLAQRAAAESPIRAAKDGRA